MRQRRSDMPESQRAPDVSSESESSDGKKTPSSAPKGDPKFAIVVLVAFIVLQLWLAQERAEMVVAVIALLVRRCGFRGGRHATGRCAVTSWDF